VSSKFVLEFLFHLALCCCFWFVFFVVIILAAVFVYVVAGASADVVGEV
jgi:hypothetical protein